MHCGSVKEGRFTATVVEVIANVSHKERMVTRGMCQDGIDVAHLRKLGFKGGHCLLVSVIGGITIPVGHQLLISVGHRSDGFVIGFENGKRNTQLFEGIIVARSNANAHIDGAIGIGSHLVHGKIGRYVTQGFPCHRGLHIRLQGGAVESGRFARLGESCHSQEAKQREKYFSHKGKISF